MALIMLVFIVGLAATAYLIHALNTNAVRIEQDKKTAAALAEAKAALIGYAASYDQYPGGIPCPDIDNDGKGDRFDNSGNASASGRNCTTQPVGRLPWKDLGLEPLRDGSGECLWYAITPVFRSALPVNNRSVAGLTALNTSTNGGLKVHAEDGSLLYPSAVVIIFAPGEALAGQDRSPSGGGICGGNNNASAYLDAVANINNAAGSLGGAGNSDFALAVKTSSFNDRLSVISQNDLMNPIIKRVLATVRGDASNGMTDFFDSGRYPFADTDLPLDGDENVFSGPGYQLGFLPVNELTFDSQTKKWLVNNGWPGLIGYKTTSSALSVTLTLGSKTLQLP